MSEEHKSPDEPSHSSAWHEEQAQLMLERARHEIRMGHTNAFERFSLRASHHQQQAAAAMLEQPAQTLTPAMSVSRKGGVCVTAGEALRAAKAKGLFKAMGENFRLGTRGRKS